MLNFVVFIVIVLLFVFLGILGIGFTMLSSLLGGVGNVFKIIKKSLGFGQNDNSSSFTSGRSQQQSSDKSSSGNYGGTGKHKGNGKVFDNNEGEYVDFEEVK